MSHKSFYFIFVISALALLAGIAAMNYSIDRWRVFSPYGEYYDDGKRIDLNVNTNYWVVKKSIALADSYDSILLGSSKVADTIDLQDVEKVYGGRWIKLSTNGGVLSEYAHNLKVLLNNGVRPKRILLGVDEYSLHGLRGDADVRYNLRPYPDTLIEKIGFWRFYLFKIPDLVDLEIIAGKYPLKNFEYNLFKDIKQSLACCYKIPSEDDTGHRNRMFYAPYVKDLTERPLIMQEEVAAYAEIVELCKKFEINLDVIFTPTWWVTLYARDFDQLNKFKRELVKYHGFHDFTDLNRYTTRAHYWMDSQHFVPHVGADIVAIVAGKRKVSGNFGRYVISDNIERHIARLDSVMSEGTRRFNELNPNTYIHASYIKKSRSLLDDSSIKFDGIKPLRNGEAILETGQAEIAIDLASLPLSEKSKVRLEFRSKRDGAIKVDAGKRGKAKMKSIKYSAGNNAFSLPTDQPGKLRIVINANESEFTNFDIKLVVY